MPKNKLIVLNKTKNYFFYKNFFLKKSFSNVLI